MQITLTANKSAVYAQVAQTCAYAGAKKDNDPSAFHRISTIEEDYAQLDRFWSEACSAFCQTLKRWLLHSSTVGQVFQAIIDVSASFDSALIESMQANCESYFVNYIIAKWFALANKPDAPEYTQAATHLLTDLQRKALYKRRPTRPRY